MLALSWIPANRLGTEFMPKLDEGSILIEARRLPGTAIADVGLQARQGDWQLTLLLRNLADRDHVASVSSVDEVYQGGTRQWRCTLSRRW